MADKAKHLVNRYSKVIILLCIMMTTLYTANELSMCWAFETLPPIELTTGVFAMYSVEFGSLAAIRIKGGRDEQADE